MDATGFYAGFYAHFFPLSLSLSNNYKLNPFSRRRLVVIDVSVCAQLEHDNFALFVCVLAQRLNLASRHVFNLIEAAHTD